MKFQPFSEFLLYQNVKVCVGKSKFAGVHLQDLYDKSYVSLTVLTSPSIGVPVIGSAVLYFNAVQSMLRPLSSLREDFQMEGKRIDLYVTTKAHTTRRHSMSGRTWSACGNDTSFK